MPTICEIKMELKELGVKGITGKNKAELMAMLEHAKAPKPKGIKIKRKPIVGLMEEPKAPEKPSKKEIEDFVKSELVRIDQMKKAKEDAEKQMPRETPLEKHNRIAEMLQKEEAERQKKPVVLKKATPPPIIPSVIKRDMKEKLLQDYDTHEYKIGFAYPLNDMIKWFKKVQNQDSYWGKNAGIAYDFLRALIVWVQTNAYTVQEYPFGTHSRTEQALLIDDWDNFFKANK
jgi:hypothetical protein